MRKDEKQVKFCRTANNTAQKSVMLSRKMRYKTFTDYFIIFVDQLPITAAGPKKPVI